MLSPIVRELMIQNDYPAPEVASRAQRLVASTVQYCADWIRQNYDQGDAEALAHYLEVHFDIHKDY